MDVISFCAGVCYGKRDISQSRVKTCWQRGHHSVFEHASFTALIEGISRACSHQLVRHRLASYSQQSLRYTRVDGDDWYVIPPDIKFNDELLAIYDARMAKYLQDYKRALDDGVLPEDARFYLPEATKTAIAVTMNARELFHFADLRTAKDAQWEIRELADTLISELMFYNDQWGELIGLWQAVDHG